MGMKTQEVPVASQSQIDVKLIEDAIGIEEVVAVGYGSQICRRCGLFQSVSYHTGTDIIPVAIYACRTV